jgi:outer membrane protein
MEKHKRMRKIVTALLVIVSLATNAQELWDLEKCINYAWTNSLSLIQSQQSEQLEAINQKQAQHTRYPSLSGSAGLGLNFGRSLDPTTDAFTTSTFFSNTFGVNAGVPIFNGFQIKNSLKQAGFNLDAAQKDTEQLKRDIALNVASAYLTALFANERQNTAQFALDLSKEQLSQIDKLIAAGSRPRNERLDLLAQIATNEQSLINGANDYTIAMLNLKQLMNYNVESEIELVVPDENAVTLFSDPDLLTFDEVYRQAVLNQPNIEAGKIRLLSAETGIDIAKGGFYPSLNAFGGLQSNFSNQGKRIDGFEEVINETPVVFNGMNAVIGLPGVNPVLSDNPYFNQLSENLAYGFGLNMNIPIYNNYQTKAAVQRAELNLHATKTQNELLTQQLKISVQQALADAQTAKKAFEASQQSVDAQQAAFENAEKRFELGAINTYDYILAKNQLDNARVNAIIAKYDYIFRTKILDFYIGRPLTL